MVDNCEESCDTVYIEVPVIEYVEVIVTDTVIEYQDLIITEYIDCDTGMPCTSNSCRPQNSEIWILGLGFFTIHFISSKMIYRWSIHDLFKINKNFSCQLIEEIFR